MTQARAHTFCFLRSLPWLLVLFVVATVDEAGFVNGHFRFIVLLLDPPRKFPYGTLRGVFPLINEGEGNSFVGRWSAVALDRATPLQPPNFV